MKIAIFTFLLLAVASPAKESTEKPKAEYWVQEFFANQAFIDEFQGKNEDDAINISKAFLATDDIRHDRHRVIKRIRGKKDEVVYPPREIKK